MNRLWLAGPLLLTIGGGALYHLAAKSIPAAANPTLVLVVAYATALVASLAMARPWHPAVIVLGAAAFMIELGYVLAYRAAWPVSTTSILTSGTVAVLLIPIGLGMFGERMSLLNALGLALCVTGLALLRR